MNSCDDCSCVKNYNDESKFCGKIVKHNNKKSTLLGCDTECCKDCPDRKKLRQNSN